MKLGEFPILIDPTIPEGVMIMVGPKETAILYPDGKIVVVENPPSLFVPIDPKFEDVVKK